MFPGKTCKTVHQYSKGEIPQEDMEKLQEIAEDYRKVKNYVYQRYGGIKSLSKLYPGYTIQNEMTNSGFRTQIGLPAVYFYLAAFDALGDIKSQWEQTKVSALKRINQNTNLSPEDRHYLRFVMKVSCLFQFVLCGNQTEVPDQIQRQYEILTRKVDAKKLNRYLCRQVRNNLHKLHTDKCGGFAISERAYRYGDQGIYISTKEKRKRVFVPLTDGNTYKRQLYVKLFPEKKGIEIDVPVEVRIHKQKDYENAVGLSVGVWQLFTTDSGSVYGERFGEFHQDLSCFIARGNKTYIKEKNNNSGRKKYKAKKAKLEARLHTYINQEVNRMIEKERPKVMYIPKFPRNSNAGVNGKINYSISLWQRGYIRKRLEQKCLERGIELAEVFSNNISRICSRCGGMGVYEKEVFRCSFCGYELEKKVNAARNAKNRGESGQRIWKEFVIGDSM